MVRSTFAGFTTALSGLSVSQRGLDVTGQNMTNVNTAGYTRQRIDQVSFSAYGQTNRFNYRYATRIGHGARINQVSQARDPFLDVRFRREMAASSEVNARSMVMDNLSDIFDETLKDGMLYLFEGFIGQLQELSKHPNDADFEGIVRGAAENITKMMYSYHLQVASIREQNEYQLNNVDIPRVNDILTSLAGLNENIREELLCGNQPLELLDKRNLLLDELSEYMKIDVQYSHTEIGKGIHVEDIEIFLITDTIPQVRTNILKNGDAAKFEGGIVAGQSYVYMNREGDVARDVTHLITSGGIKGTLDMLNKSGAFDSPPTDIRGIGFYEQSLDALAQMFAQMLNDANSRPNPGFDPEQPEHPVDNPKFLYDHPLFEAGDGSGRITASNIALAQDWVRGDYSITFSKDFPITTGDDTSGARDNILAMISLFNEKVQFYNDYGQPLFNGTIIEYIKYNKDILALDLNSEQSVADSHELILHGIWDMRDSISSVNMDEEGVNLLRYRNAYNGAARLMTTLDEAVDTIVNRMGIVGR